VNIGKNISFFYSSANPVIGDRYTRHIWKNPLLLLLLSTFFFFQKGKSPPSSISTHTPCSSFPVLCAPFHLPCYLFILKVFMSVRFSRGTGPPPRKPEFPQHFRFAAFTFTEKEEEEKKLSVRDREQDASVQLRERKRQCIFYVSKPFRSEQESGDFLSRNGSAPEKRCDFCQPNAIIHIKPKAK
jgi:hypothetical protein